MNRRSFLQKAAACAAVATVAPAALAPQPFDIKRFFDAANIVKRSRVSTCLTVRDAGGCSLTRATFAPMTPADIVALYNSMEAANGHPA